MERIVVGVDGSESSRRALRWAVAEARRRRAGLDIVHAWSLPYGGWGSPYFAGLTDPALFERDAQHLLDREVAGEDVGGLARVDSILVHDTAAGALLDTAKGADLLVVGCRGRGGFSGLLLGSVSQQVAAHGPCPVVIVTGDGERATGTVRPPEE